MVDQLKPSFPSTAIGDTHTGCACVKLHKVKSFVLSHRIYNPKEKLLSGWRESRMRIYKIQIEVLIRKNLLKCQSDLTKLL
jgi:hypothetical protein